MRYTIQKTKTEKEGIIIDNFFDFIAHYELVVKFFSPIITLGLAIINLVFVILIFKFNRRMSQSKISITVRQMLSFLAQVNAAVKPVNDFRLEEKEIIHDKTFFNPDISKLHGEGYPLENKVEQLVFLKLQNKGDSPSVNIKIDLLVKIYKTENTYDSDSIIIKSKKVLGYQHPYKIDIAYMGSDEIRFIDLYTHKSNFRESEIVLLKIEANGHKYFKESFWNRNRLLKKWRKPTIIESFSIPELISINDPEDAAKVYGSKSLWEQKYKEEQDEHTF